MRLWLVVPVLGVSLLSQAADERPAPKTADRIMIVKSTHTLTLLNHGQVLKGYKVALGGDPVGPKAKAGDKKTGVIDQIMANSPLYRSNGQPLSPSNQGGSVVLTVPH